MRAQWRHEEGIKSPAEGGRSARSLSAAWSLDPTPPTVRGTLGLSARPAAVTDRYRASGRRVARPPPLRTIRDPRT
ncbi:unnamed protein product, partial [Brenthis ino]